MDPPLRDTDTIFTLSGAWEATLIVRYQFTTSRSLPLTRRVPYAAATENIEKIVNEIVNSEKLSSPACLRLALVAFRDHPPQE